MLQNVSIRAKLLILSVVFFGVLALASGMGVYFLKHQRDDVASLYADRVVPLQQLKTVADMYAVNVVDTVHKVRDGALSAEQGAKLIAEAKSTVDKQWNAYASTFLIEKEKTLIQKIKPLMAAANVAVDRVDALIKGRDQAQLAEFAAKQLYPALDPLQEVISELILVQLDVSKEIAEDSATTYRTALLGFGGFVALAVAAGGLVASAITRAIAKPMGVAAHALERIAAGDLTVKVLASGKDETAGMLRALASMTERLSQVVSGVRSSADGVATASQQIADGNLDLSSRTEEQAASLQQTATSMEQITSTVKHNADNASQGNQLAQTASSVATRGGEVVQKVVSTMLEINNSSKKISDIIGVIDGIAFQTNILALNAAVEAARAGEQGRGFAVVATEVRSLAQRSAEAAREIKALITASVERVQVGTTLVDEAGSTMREIVASIARVADIMGEITAASNEQSSGIGQVNQAVAQMDAATQQNAALVEQASAAAASLREQANQLVQAVSVFQVTDKPA